TIKTVAPRGKIFDRNDEVLVTNRPSFNVALLTEDVGNVDETLLTLSDVTGRPITQLQEALTQQRKRRRFEPQVVIFDAARDEVAKVKANTYRLPGVIVEVFPARVYPYSDLASQTFGYVREITRTHLDEPWARGYRPGD